MRPKSFNNTTTDLRSASNEFILTVNGKTFLLGPDVPPTTTLLQFLRSFVILSGTKGLCYEGGCGVCTVVVTTPDLEKGGHKTFSVRACQTLVYACVGWSVVTIEHMGNRHIGYDKLQTALHAFYGTQCGYCSPGFVMTMHGEMETSKELKVDRIEKALDGNICRCTGYRPILDAFKSFGSNAPKHLASKLKDIEEAYDSQCPQTGLKCSAKYENEKEWNQNVFSPDKSLVMERDGVIWHRPTTIQDIYDILKVKKSSDKVRLVVGNTGQGVFKTDGPYNVYVNLTGVKELYNTVLEPTVLIGSNTSLSRCIEVFLSAARHKKGYQHLDEVTRHWEVVANVAVRNAGSWAGNMMMKHAHPGFCSDIFITLVAIDARIKVGRFDGQVTEMSAEEFLSSDMTNSVILSMELPPQSQNVIVRSHKISPRAVNAHAYVNACFKFHVDPKDQMRVINLPAIVLGGINPSFIRASKTEMFFLGRFLSSSNDVNEAIKILGDELKPDSNLEDASPKFRTSLAQCLLYKTIIRILDKSVPPSIYSGGINLQRPVSSSKQTFDANEDSWPIGQAIPKLESLRQISGEAEYLDDIPILPDELFGAFVQSTVARGKIKSIVTAECLKLPGVVDFIKASDIPGKNTFFSDNACPDPIFADTEIKYAGQSIGLVIAKSRQIAKEGVTLVKIEYEDVHKPVLTIKEAIRENRFEKSADFVTSSTDPLVYGDIEAGFKNSKYVVEGEVELGTQFQFPMEPLAARVVPVEEGYDVYCTSQWPTLTQSVVASNLGISANSINMSVRRIGGAFGSKISRQNIVSSAAAVAAHKLKKPVRITTDLSTHMTLVGWREPYFSKYKIGFSDEGIFESVCVDIYGDVGYVPNENSSPLSARTLPSTYHCPNWKIQPYNALTDTAANTWCRAPGQVQAIATMENLVERVAHYLKKDPLTIREINLSHKDKPRPFTPRKEDNLVKSNILPLLKTQADIKDRRKKVNDFNEENRWKKRGLSWIPLRYSMDTIKYFQYNVQVVIYEHDGTIAITHGGIEMGQGINTKVAQVAAKILDVSVDFIKIKPTNVFTGANSFITGGSFGSDLNAHGVKICCEKIRSRMDEVAKKMEMTNGPVSWPDLVKQCFSEQVDLCERYFTVSKEHPKGYDVWAAACLEVELDVLTGQFLILRTDIIEDCGRSLSPYVDMGQVEGAFVMGLGFYTSEKVKFNPETGQKLSNSTWEYNPPTALDIPIDFRVSFLPRGDNPGGVLRSKATGEPPLCLSYVVVLALREAIKSAREDTGNYEWFQINTPLTVEKIHELCNVDPSQLKF